MDTRLAAVIVHDIKNALGVLEGRLQRLTVDPGPDEAVLAHESCVLLRERLVAFLTLYKASSLGLHPRIEALNPEDFLNALVRTRAASRPDLRITITTADAPVFGFFDEHLVGLALEAALQNASRFARSAIEIACAKEEGGGLRFAVRDDGPGLGTNEETPSTGLGMELCKVIAEAHCKDGRRGGVSLHDDPGGGAAFVLWLP